LGQAFTRWQAEQPELFEQFRLWLVAHREDSAGGCWRPVQSARPAG
jgi:hypothetical protein